MKNCPCGSGKSYSECCEVFISGHQLPTTAEQLMRSRYSAYHQGKFDYIINTMKSPAADHFDLEEAKKSAELIRWTALEIVHSSTHTVEFRAHYRTGQDHHILHETSQFTNENGTWYYVDGTHHTK